MTLPEVPSAGHYMDGNRTDQHLLTGRLVIEADFDLSTLKAPGGQRG